MKRGQSTEINDMARTLTSDPQNLTSISGDEYVNLTWEAPAIDGGLPITNYRINRGITPGAEVFLIQIGNMLYYEDVAINGWTNYYYTIAAVTGAGEGPESNEVSANPRTAPDIPTGLSSSTGDLYVNLTWNAPANGGYPITDYYIYRSVDGGSESYLAAAGPQLYYNDTSPSGWVDNYYRVSAVNAIGEGGLSTSTGGIPQKVPYAPLNLTAISGEMEAFLDWEEPLPFSSITNFYIYRGIESGNLTYLATIPSFQYDYTDMPPVINQTYYYAVTAVNLYGEGAPSNEEMGMATGPQGPIVVDGNADFATKAAYYHWSGIGTPGDPYIIQSRILDTGSYEGINIQNTDVHFQINNVIAFGMNNNAGASFFNVSNGTLHNVTFENNLAGIILTDCIFMNISSCKILNNTMEGIVILSSDYIYIYNSTIENCGSTGTMMDSSTNTEIYMNNISNNFMGMMLNFSTTNIIFLNNFINNMMQAEDNSGGNQWDDGIAGNYWSEYVDVDIAPMDGIWDNPYMIPGTAMAFDNLPLAMPFI